MIKQPYIFLIFIKPVSQGVIEQFRLYFQFFLQHLDRHAGDQNLLIQESSFHQQTPRTQGRIRNPDPAASLALIVIISRHSLHRLPPFTLYSSIPLFAHRGRSQLPCLVLCDLTIVRITPLISCFFPPIL